MSAISVLSSIYESWDNIILAENYITFSKTQNKKEN